MQNGGGAHATPRCDNPVNRGNGQWVFLAIDTEPHYVDTLALAPGTSAIWKYRALYLDADQPFGQWSDTVQIAVQG